MPFDDSNGRAKQLTGLDRLWASVVRPLTFLGYLMGSLLFITATGMLVRTYFGPETGVKAQGFLFLGIAIAVLIATAIVRHKSIHTGTSYCVLDRLGL